MINETPKNPDRYHRHHLWKEESNPIKITEPDLLRNHKGHEQSKTKSYNWQKNKINQIVGECIPELIITKHFFKVVETHKSRRLSEAFPFCEGHIHCLRVGVNDEKAV